MVTPPTTPCSPSRQCWLRAWYRAKQERLIPYKNTDGNWSVKTYTATVTGTGWSDLVCSSPAGRQGKICKHAAVVDKAIACHVLPVRGTARATANLTILPAPIPSEAPAPGGAPVWRNLTGPSPLDALFGK